MEKYEDMESDTFDTGATATTGEQEHEGTSQKEQMIRQLEVGGEETDWETLEF